MIDLNDIDTAPARYDLEEIVRRLRASAESWVPGMFPNGRRDGDDWRLANIQGAPPRRSGSCAITLRGEHAGDWHDFDGGAGGGPLSTLAQGTGLADRALFAHAAALTGWTGAAPARQEPPPERKPARDATQEIAFIRQHAAPIQGSAAERYLQGRGLAVPEGADLLFHPDLTNFENRAGYPAMIGLVRNLAGEVVALHRTYLREEGAAVLKADIAKPRLMLGKTGGGTVRLGPIGPAGVLGLCEGIETGLAAMLACPGLPVWAALSTSGLEQAQLPPEARRIVILADHDASGAGLRAADATAAKLRLEGRTVSIALPPREGDDVNDMLLREGAAAIAALVDRTLRSAAPAPVEAEPETGRHLPMGFVEPKHSLPTVRADEGNLDRATARAWHLVLAANRSPWLFRLGGEPSWVVPDDDGRPVPVTVRDERLRHMLAKLGDWRRLNSKGDLVPTPPPTGLVKSMVATPDPALPVLSGIVTAPVFGRGGILLTAPGYHPDARLLYRPTQGFMLPAVPERPTTEDIAAARSLLLDELLGDFPFVGEAERAHALCLLLLGFVRAMIDGPTPLHLIEKPTPGTGATLMVDAIATILTGSGASVMTEGRDEDEWRKRLTAKLRQLPTLLLIDNLRQELDSSAFAAALTAPQWEDRVLGASEMVRLPVRCVWVATGNNPSFSNEIARRLIRIRLDARSDQPWRRDGFRHPSLIGWVQANRGALVAACLTLCKAWIVAGKPRGTRSIGSFEAWAQILGGILEVCGVAGFLGNLEETMEASDREGPAWRAFVQTWWDRFGSAEVVAGDLLEFAHACEPGLPIEAKTAHGARIALGMALRRMRDRGFRLRDRLVHLRASAQVNHSQRWRLAPSDETSSPNEAFSPVVPAPGRELRELGGNFDGQVPFPQSQGIAGVQGTSGTSGTFSNPYTHARAYVCEEESEKVPEIPEVPENSGNLRPSGQGTSRELPAGFPSGSLPPAWLDGVP